MYEQFLAFISDYQSWLHYLAFASMGLLVLSILFIPKLVAKIPNDYFIRTPKEKKPFSFIRFFTILIRNIIGSVLVLCGILMLVLPGQGLLTIFVGLLLLDFPGKLNLERYLITKPSVINSLNWLRRKQNVSDLIVK